MPDTNIPVTCPHCDAAFTAPADVAGLPITCPICEKRFTAPAAPPRWTVAWPSPGFLACVLGLILALLISAAVFWVRHANTQLAPREPEVPLAPASTVLPASRLDAPPASAAPEPTPAERDTILRAYLDAAARSLAKKYVETEDEIKRITLRQVTDARQAGLDIAWPDLVVRMDRLSWSYAPPQHYDEFLTTFISLRQDGASDAEAEQTMVLVLAGLDEVWAPRSVHKEVSITALWREFRDNQIAAAEAWFWQRIQFERRIRSIDKALDGTILVQFGNTLQAHVTCYVAADRKADVLKLKRRGKTYVEARVLGYNQYEGVILGQCYLEPLRDDESILTPADAPPEG